MIITNYFISTARHSPKKNFSLVTVDGLGLCNEQLVRSTMEVNQNVSVSSGDASSNASQGSGHSSANFPFVEGNPFTATLWVGLEGFHVTVNGRHETSFAYREVRCELIDKSKSGIFF